MNPDVKRKWVDALRKGEVNGRPVVQTSDYLRKKDLPDGTQQMCCLGVLTELAIADGVEITRSDEFIEAGASDHFDYRGPNGETSTPGKPFNYNGMDLCVPVQQWAGLESCNPSVAISDGILQEVKGKDPWVGIGMGQTVDISVVNDNTERGFAGIADIIEEQF